MISLFKTLEHSLWKATRKRDKRLAKARSDRHKRLEKALETDKLRREVYARDKGKCRVCGTPVTLYGADDFTRLNMHHITYLSAGGSDTLENVVSLCLSDHAREHEHVIMIEGNPNRTLTITRYDVRTREVRSVVDSPCPS